MMPNPSRRAASKTSESRRPVRAARTRTWRIRPSSIESVVFTFAIFPYCHIQVQFGYLPGQPQQRTSGAGLAAPTDAARFDDPALASQFGDVTRGDLIDGESVGGGADQEPG